MAVVGNRPVANLDELLDHLRFRPDGSTSLHVQTPLLHIYYSQDVINELENGLFALVADGINKVHPERKRSSIVRMEKSQLYIIHGVCRRVCGMCTIQMPLLFPIIRHKTEEDYIKIFDEMEKVLQALHRMYRIPSVNSGCSWNLSQALVRNRNSVGILCSLKGEERSDRVVTWWRTVKGLPFLQRENFILVDVLRVYPVEVGHLAYLRTTNLAEYYHARLRKDLCSRRHPHLDVLVLHLQNFTVIAKVGLSRMR
ncbi:hypothetical protein Aduo_018366 [Ancylostoma duodenale]